MIAEDVQRKLWMGGLIGALVLGVLFLVWAVFLNRGTLIIKSKAPFSVTIGGLRTESCAADECTTVVAPGDYTITVQKTGYKPLTKNITVPLGAPYQDSVTLQFIPVIAETTQLEDAVFKPDPQLNAADLDRLGITASTRLFFDEAKKVFAFVKRNPENYNQTLYASSLDENGNASDPEIVTSFLRDLQNYVIVPAADGKKVAIIDLAPDQSTLYVVNREAKNRASLLTYPVIRGMRWLPQGNDFLFQAREKNQTAESIYLYRWDDGTTEKLELKTTLGNIAVVNKNRIIAVTTQKLPAGSTPDKLEGQLVLLGETQSTAEVAAGTAPAPTHVYPFVDYSLIANQARLLTVLNGNPYPSKMAIGTDGKSVDFLRGDKVFQLRFEE
jgi:hypothetical protein